MWYSFNVLMEHFAEMMQLIDSSWICVHNRPYENTKCKALQENLEKFDLFENITNEL